MTSRISDSDSDVAFFGTRPTQKQTPRQTKTERTRRLAAMEIKVQAERAKAEAERAKAEAEEERRKQAEREQRLSVQRAAIRRKIEARQEREAEEQALLEQTDDFAQWAKQRKRKPKRTAPTSEEQAPLEPPGSDKHKRLAKRVLESIDQRPTEGRPAAAPEEPAAPLEPPKSEKHRRLAKRVLEGVDQRPVTRKRRPTGALRPAGALEPPKGNAKLQRLERRVQQEVDPAEVVTPTSSMNREEARKARLTARRAELRREIEIRQQREAEEQALVDQTDDFAQWRKEREQR